MNEKIQTGILTISDRCAQGIYKDKSGPALWVIIEKKGWTVSAADIVPDQKEEIIKKLLHWCDHRKLDSDPARAKNDSWRKTRNRTCTHPLKLSI